MHGASSSIAATARWLNRYDKRSSIWNGFLGADHLGALVRGGVELLGDLRLQHPPEHPRDDSAQAPRIG
jgi:hypothetical protein